jgi:hypothetical protein
MGLDDVAAQHAELVEALARDEREKLPGREGFDAPDELFRL